jgi:hypothetical protein
MHCILSEAANPVSHAWLEEEAIFCRDYQQVKHHDHVSEAEENDREERVQASVCCRVKCLCGSEKEEVVGNFHPS